MSYSDIPYKNNNKHNTMDLEDEIREKLSQFEGEFKDKYKEDYYRQEYDKLKQKLELEMQSVKRYLDPLVKRFIEGERSYQWDVYGPNVDEHNMYRNKAWKTFRKWIESKNYNWSSRQSSKHVVDIMEGRCEECTEYVTIN